MQIINPPSKYCWPTVVYVKSICVEWLTVLALLEVAYFGLDAWLRGTKVTEKSASCLPLVALRYIDDITRVVISYGIYQTSLMVISYEIYQTSHMIN